jgi:hypothetical protein
LENLWGFKDLVLLLACSLATQSFAAFCVSKIVVTENIITSKNSGLNENHIFQERKNLVNMPFINPEKVYLPLLHIKLGLI